jgi:hypothetical protein
MTAATPNEPRFRLKIVPILVTAALGYGVPYVAGYAAFYSSKIFHITEAKALEVSMRLNCRRSIM